MKRAASQRAFNNKNIDTYRLSTFFRLTLLTLLSTADKPCGWRREPILFIHPCVINKKVRKIMYWLSLPNGAMGLNLWGSLTSKLDGYPIDLNPSPAGPSQSMKKIASA